MQSTITTNIKYYDIGLNLFCRQFPEPDQIIQSAIEANVCCILTGTDPKENQKNRQLCQITSCIWHSGNTSA